MNNSRKTEIAQVPKIHKSKAGYTFSTNDNHWQLDKNNIVPVGAARDLLKQEIRDSFENTLIFYACNLSASHTFNLCNRFLGMLRVTGQNEISVNMLINFRSTLNPKTEWYLGSIRGLLKKWRDLGYIGVSDEVVDLLNGWKLKGNIKGDVVKRLDPLQGPLSDIELHAFNEGVVQAFERNQISITDLAISLITSSTGRRQIQISHLKVKDILRGKNKKGEDYFLINIPRAKQRNASFRSSFKQFAITYELWVILNGQSSIVKNEFKRRLPFDLTESDLLELPLFADWEAVATITDPKELKLLLFTDNLHIPASRVTEQIKIVSKEAGINSERTGEALQITSKRFRYTTGTRAAREGFGSMIVAELLDHTDTQNAHVYIENVPEHVAKLDQALGHQLARYAQAFAGMLVDSEADARRGEDINSRVKTDGNNVGTCGSYGFCGANVPIPCYTCRSFQPWLDGPHELVYEKLIAERMRLIEITGELTIASINDRSILAVANVIQLCAKRREEIKNG